MKNFYLGLRILKSMPAGSLQINYVKSSTYHKPQGVSYLQETTYKGQDALPSNKNPLTCKLEYELRTQVE